MQYIQVLKEYNNQDHHRPTYYKVNSYIWTFPCFGDKW